MAELKFMAEMERLRTHRLQFMQRFFKQAFASEAITARDRADMKTWWSNQNRKRCKIKLMDSVLASTQSVVLAGGDPVKYVENWLKDNYRSIFIYDNRQPWKHQLSFFKET